MSRIISRTGNRPSSAPSCRLQPDRATAADDRRTIEGILYILITGCRWQDLPREYGAPTTAWRRLKRWGEEGVWERIWRAALAALDQRGQLDWSMAFLDGSFAPAKKGGEKVGSPRRARAPSGCSWSTAMDCRWASTWTAPRCGGRLAEQTLDTIRVARPRGRPKRRPEKLVADRGYDSSAFRHALRRPRHPDVHPAEATPGELEGQAGTPGGGAQGRLSAAVQSGTELRLAGQFPAAAHPLGAALQRLPELIRFRGHAAVCAPSDCPRVPDPVGVRRARAVYAARSVQPSWSTNGSGPNQRT